MNYPPALEMLLTALSLENQNLASTSKNICSVFILLFSKLGHELKQCLINTTKSKISIARKNKMITMNNMQHDCSRISNQIPRKMNKLEPNSV